MCRWCNKLVLVGFVIESKGEVLNYINRFNEVFSKVRASPFSKKPLFNSYSNKVKLFSDRLVFMYSGKITAFSTLMYLLRFSIFIAFFLLFFVLFGALTQFFVIARIIFWLILVGLIIQGSYLFMYSKYGFWLGHLRTFRKKKFNLHKNKKRLLSSEDLMNCFVCNKKPLFKDELGVL